MAACVMPGRWLRALIISPAGMQPGKRQHDVYSVHWKWLFCLLFCLVCARTYWNSKESRGGTNKKQQRITQGQRDLVLSLYFICPDRVDHRSRKWTDDHMSLSNSLSYHIYFLSEGRWEILKAKWRSSELEQRHYFTNSSSAAPMHSHCQVTQLTVATQFKTNLQLQSNNPTIAQALSHLTYSQFTVATHCTTI